MKIECSYCGNSFDDYLEKCPNCGAPSDALVRTASDTPRTIEELQEWYKSKGLPPAETTRFFIGVDYKKPRAFGIYKDPSTGVVVVYKNKDNGERAVRYQGTDEAYGVNELYQRLKQEIIQQKMNNVKKAQGSSNYATNNKAKNIGSSMLKKLLAVLGACFAMFMGIVLIGVAVIFFSPSDGYYDYQNHYYYYDGAGNSNLYVFEYDETSADWKKPVEKDAEPGIFDKKKTCKPYFLSEKWEASYACSDISDSIVYKDYKKSADVHPVYYTVNEDYYYHRGFDYYTDWFYYDDDDWVSVDVEGLPVEMTHASTVSDFFYTTEWDSSTQFSDFTESEIYAERFGSSSDSSDSDDYSWDSSDSWDSDSTDWGSDW